MCKIAKIKSAIIIVFICSFFTILIAIPSFAQGSDMRHGPGMRPGKGESPCWRAFELNLSQEQRKGFDLIQQTYFQDAQLIRAQLFTKRLELRELLVNPAVKIDSIRMKYLEIIELQSKQEERVIEYLIKVRNLLTLDQLQRWCPEQEFPLFRQMMHGTGPRGPKRFKEE